MTRIVMLVCVAALLAAAPSDAGFAVDEVALASRFAEVAGGPSRVALKAALTAYARAAGRGEVGRTDRLTIIDYTRPSTEPRLWVLALDAGRVLYRELVAHGRASGDNRTTHFSNVEGSLMSSLGLFVTGETYLGRNGYSLRLHGLQPGLNDRAYDRAIVMHGAPYVSEATAAQLGRLGRSWGCPAVRTAVARELIDTIKGGTVLFAYGVPVTT